MDLGHNSAMVALNGLLKSHVFANLKDMVYFDAVNFERTASFAEKLAPNNVMPNIHVDVMMTLIMIHTLISQGRSSSVYLWR
jgi:hypothetical protein